MLDPKLKVEIYILLSLLRFGSQPSVLLWMVASQLDPSKGAWLKLFATRSKCDPLASSNLALVCWCPWRHRNDIVFEGGAPSSVVVVRLIRGEAQLWKVAGLFRAELAQIDRWRLGE
jgi:hypothetical protein